jgi:glyoxylase-like metal-dependent hydrolase (beta-lactamase superfamily II)
MQEEWMMKTKAAFFSRAFLLALAVMTVSAEARPQAPPDYSKVEIKTTKITDHFYTLEGQGGTIGVLVGSDGVFMVDSEFAPLSDKIVAAVKQITDAPIRFLVDTHFHGDHTGGNENFAKMGVTIIARDELRKRLADGAPAVNGAAARPPVPPAALPMITYEGKMTIHMDDENVELNPIPRAHTDGDTMVGFPENNVIMTGDFYRSVGYPNIDRANGGTLNGMIDGLAYLVYHSGPDTKIIPGHGPIVAKERVRLTREMILALRDKVAALIQQGKSEQEVLAAHPTADYDAKVPQGPETADRFVSQLYQELKSGAGSGGGH